MEFKDRLKKLRIERGLTQAELAELIFVSRSAVAKWENGLGLPNDASVESLANLFSITKEELLSEDIEEKLVEKNVKIYKLNVIKYGLISFLSIAIVAIVILSICLINSNKYKAYTYVAPEISLNDSNDYYAPNTVITTNPNVGIIIHTSLPKDKLLDMTAIPKTLKYEIESNYEIRNITANYFYLNSELDYVDENDELMENKKLSNSTKLWFSTHKSYELDIKDNTFLLPESEFDFLIRINLYVDNIGYTYFFLIK